MTQEQDIIWLAGLLEGEGCFSTPTKKNKTIVLQLEMTDEDVVKHAAVIMASEYRAVKRNKLNPRYKTTYRIRLYGERAASMMRLLLPFMGERRSSRIAECLNDHSKRETREQKSLRMTLFNLSRSAA